MNKGKNRLIILRGFLKEKNLKIQLGYLIDLYNLMINFHYEK